MTNLEDIATESKPLPELIFEEEFIVTNVLSQTNLIDDNIFSLEFDKSLQINKGYAPNLTLNVIPAVLASNKNIPIKELIFYGNSPVRKGDIIKAKVPRFKLENRESATISTYNRIAFYDRPYHAFYDRPYQTTERAIEISIVDGEKIVRIDRAIDYPKYQKNYY